MDVRIILKKLQIFVAIVRLYKVGGFAKSNSKLDFEYKSVSQIQSNTKVTQKPSETTTAPL